MQPESIRIIYDTVPGIGLFAVERVRLGKTGAIEKIAAIRMADSPTPKKRKALTWSDMIAAGRIELPKGGDLDSLLSEIDNPEVVVTNPVLWARQAELACSIFCDLLSPPHPLLCLHPQAKIAWEPCSDLPVGMFRAQTVVIKEKTYCGGGDTAAAADDDRYRVICYSLSEDTWTTLPPCPVHWFGLGQVRGKLVTVGGWKKSDCKVTNEVYEFDEVTQTWKPSIPPMPTARHSPAVLSHHSALIVAGGFTEHTRTPAVEVFREETSQWHTTEPLPFCWYDASSLVINSRWYLLGGVTKKGEDRSNRALCAHVDLLLQRTLNGNRASTDSNGTVWEVLPNTPLYAPAAATFGTSLLAVGGTTTSKYPPNLQAAVHVYSPCTNTWIHISDLPAPLVWAATAMLSPTELLVIGGYRNERLNKAYKGLLQTE